MKCLLTLLAALMLAPLAALHTAEKLPDDRNWLQKNGTLIFYDAFEREEEGNLAKAIGNGWNSATADRVPNIKQAHLDKGILKIASATKEAGHNAHIHLGSGGK